MCFSSSSQFADTIEDIANAFYDQETQRAQKLEELLDKHIDTFQQTL